MKRTPPPQGRWNFLTYIIPIYVIKFLLNLKLLLAFSRVCHQKIAFILGELYLESGDAQSALDIAKKLHKSNPENESILLLDANAAADLGRTSELIKFVRRAHDPVLF
jgi:hypothetical protein